MNPRTAGRIIVAALALAAVPLARAEGALSITIDAPASLAQSAARLRDFDAARLADDLARAGLPLPAAVHVTLIPGGDARAARVPPWVVGLAYGSTEIAIFADRILTYPYDSLESVLRHEIAHLALSARAAPHALPRWFHEGVAVSVDAGWDLSSQLQLLLAMRRDPGLASLRRLFAAGNEPDSALAYRLSAALVADLRRRHGAAAPGAIAARVGAGTAFERAFQLETGETPDAAAAEAWTAYRRWTTWVSALTSDAMPWVVILALAFVAFGVRARQRAHRRRRWDAEEDGAAGPAAPP